MAVLKPFRCVRPAPGQAEKTAALPYDVFNEREARIETAANPLSFLNIDRPETQFPEGTDPCGEEVYQMAKELFEGDDSPGHLCGGRRGGILYL